MRNYVLCSYVKMWNYVMWDYEILSLFRILQGKYNFAKGATIYLMMLSLRDLLFHVPVHIGVIVTLKSHLYLNFIHIWFHEIFCELSNFDNITEQLKVHIYSEKTSKIRCNLPLSFDTKFLWPSQKTWTFRNMIIKILLQNDFEPIAQDFFCPKKLCCSRHDNPIKRPN